MTTSTLKYYLIEYLETTDIKYIRSINTWKALEQFLESKSNNGVSYSWKTLRRYFVTELIHEIRERKIDLPDDIVQHLCYPYLMELCRIRAVITNTDKQIKLLPEKFIKHKLILRYYLNRNKFNEDIWKDFHRIFMNNKVKFYLIHINNHQYELTKAEKIRMHRFISKTHVENNEIKQTATNVCSGDWLTKKGAIVDNRIMSNDLIDSTFMEEEIKQSSGEYTEENVQNEIIYISSDDEEFTIPYSFYDNLDSDSFDEEL